MTSKTPHGAVNIMSRVDFIRMASTEMAQAVVFLTYDTTDERTSHSRSKLLHYVTEIGITTEAQAIECYGRQRIADLEVEKELWHGVALKAVRDIKQLQSRLEIFQCKSFDELITENLGLQSQVKHYKDTINNWRDSYAPDPLPDGVSQFVDDLQEQKP